MKQPMKKYFSAALCLFALSTMLFASACSNTGGADSGGDGAVDVVMWGWGEEWGFAFEAYMEAEAPDVNFEYVAVDGDEYVQKLQAAVSAGTRLPDIAALEMDSRGQLMSLGIFENLESPPYGLDRSEIMDFLIPLCTNSEGQVVGVETQPAPGGLAYRRELAKEYLGTDDPSELESKLQTWDDFIALGKEVKEKSGGKVYMFASIDEAAFILTSQNSQPFVTEDGKSNLTAALKGGFETTKEMYDAGIVDVLGDQTPAWNASLSGGEHIFYACPTWYPFYVIEPNDPEGIGQWGIISPPGGGYNMGGTLFGIPSEAGTEASRLEAWKFIKWLTLSEAGAEWIRDNWDSASSYKPIYSDPGFFEGQVNPYFEMNLPEAFLRISQDVTTRPITKYDTIVVDELMPQGYRDIEAGKSVDEIMAGLEKSFKEQAGDLKG
ncbi:MAG: extracellular solute-binding protein [Clostridiales Family XIII bacterium]|jgi:multiple sugar transport system substrate-binding protein|nr:extracellular solute-binding protein [Clostridiales Family XIII bacterium]